MDARLVVPAISIWLGAAATFVITGLGADIFARYQRAGAILVGASVLVVFITVVIVVAHFRGIIAWDDTSRVALGIGVCAFLVGMVPASLNVMAHTTEPLATWIDAKERVDVRGVIVGEPQVRVSAAGAVWMPAEVQEVVLATSVISRDAKSVDIDVPISLVTELSVVVPPPGTHVLASGRLGVSFQYGNFAAALNGVEEFTIVSEPGVIDSLAQSMRDGLRRALMGIDQRSGSLIAGLAIGDESAVPAELETAMRHSGLAHLTAVSGGNVAIVLAMVLLLAVVLGLQLVGRVVLSLASLGFYVVLVQPQPSVVRAATMGVIVVLALLSGGKKAGPSVLATAVIILIIFDPSLALSWGFALSVAATAGIIMLTPFLVEWSSKTPYLQRTPPALIAAVALTLGAQLATLPVIGLMAVPIGLGSLPANLLALPAVPFITVGGLLSACASLVNDQVAHGIAVVSSIPSGFIVFLAEYFSTWPLFTPFSLLMWLMCVAAVSVVGVFAWRHQQRWSTVIVIAVIAAVVGFQVLRSLNPWLPSDWFLVMCDVGQGDALVIREPGGNVMVIDAGPLPEKIDECLTHLGVREVAAVVITHYHRDHVGGIGGVLRGREVERIFATPYGEPQDQKDLADKVLAEDSRGLDVEVMQAGQSWTLGALQFDVLWPSRVINSGSVPNNASVVMLVTLENQRIVLTGDIEREAQLAIMRANPAVGADIVKVPHHGSANLDPGFAAWTGGQVALVSVGHDNDYGHPTRDSLEAWAAAEIVRTDLSGTVAISVSDQGNLVLSRER